MASTSSAMTKEFTFQFLEQITDHFSEECQVGAGAYGVVYKGLLENGEEIALKKFHSHIGVIDDKLFKNELDNLVKARHQNIVHLVGYCHHFGPEERYEHNGKYVSAQVQERVLCFEYLHGGNLEKHLLDQPCRLDWHACYKIIKGVCEGLNYLHTGAGCKDPIYHLDLKPENILLDKNMMPKIGDFGLSRLFPPAQTWITEKIIGTLGYMPPEYINESKISSKSDVFSIGVIIIKIMAGTGGQSKLAEMHSKEFIKHVHAHWLARMNSKMLSHISRQVKMCIEIAVRCVEADRQKRPYIADIVDQLNKIDTDDSIVELDEIGISESLVTGQQTCLDGLLPKLGLLQEYEPRVIGITSVQGKLRRLQAALHRVGEVPRDMWDWADDMREVSRNIEKVVDRLTVDCERAANSGCFMGYMKKLTARHRILVGMDKIEIQVGRGMELTKILAR